MFEDNARRNEGFVPMANNQFNYLVTKHYA